MKIKADKNVLQEGIQVVQNIVSAKATLPILSNILLEASGTTLRMNTTDLDIGISCAIPVEVVEEGAITIPSKRFGDIIRELPPGEISINVKKNSQVDIDGKQCRFKLMGIPKEEFPKFPEFKDKEVLKINQGTLKEMLRMTSFAVSHEGAPYVLNGVLFEVSGEILRLVATDGRRLAKIEKKLDSAAAKETSLILPQKAVQEILRNLQNDDGEVAFISGGNQVLFDIGGILIATRLIEGDFPNYNQVIPKPAPAKIKIKTQDLLSAIRRANLLTTPDFQAIKLEVFSDKMVLSKVTPDVGESREEVAIVYEGKEMVVGFNPQFFIDVLKNIEEEEVSLELLGPDKAGVLRMKDYLYLMMPMRI